MFWKICKWFAFIFTGTALLVAIMAVGFQLHGQHLKGSGGEDYNPISSRSSNEDMRPYGIFKVDHSKTDVAIRCQTPTEETGDKWQAKFGPKRDRVEDFETLQEMNDALFDRYGLQFRPLTFWESVWKSFKSMFQ